jgi:hypothetical protein
MSEARTRAERDAGRTARGQAPAFRRFAKAKTRLAEIERRARRPR